MNPQILDALDTVIAWGLPDEDLEAAINNQARLIAGDDPEDTWDRYPDSPFSSHH